MEVLGYSSIITVINSLPMVAIPKECETRWRYNYDIVAFVLKYWNIVLTVVNSYNHKHKKPIISNGNAWFFSITRLERILCSLAFSIDKLQRNVSSYGLLHDIKEELVNSIRSLNLDVTTTTLLLNPIYSYFEKYVDEGLSKLCYLLNFQKESDGDSLPNIISDIDNYVKRSKGPIYPYHWDIIKQWINHKDYGVVKPADFWLEHCYDFKEIIFPYLCLPSSSASVERGFSIEKHVHSTLRNRLSSGSINMEMFFRYNKSYINSLREFSNEDAKRRKKNILSIYKHVL